MRIGIEINGVLRNTIEKITQIYQKFYIDNPNDYVLNKVFNLDISGNTEEQDIQEPFKYEMNLPVTSLTLTNHFKFQNEEEYYSFLYEEHPMEIFGHSPSTEMTTFNDLNSIYVNFRDKHDFLIVSDEIGKSKPASLFFLSKFGCEIEKIKFYSHYTLNSMWDEVDVLVTSNPDLLLNPPYNKIIIKFETDYNKDISISDKIVKIKELEEIINNL